MGWQPEVFGGSEFGSLQKVRLVHTYESLLIRLVAFSRCSCEVEINVSILGDGRDMEDRPQERLHCNI